METPLTLLTISTVIWSVFLSSVLLKSQRNTFEHLSYSIKKFDCQNAVEDILNPSTSQQIIYAGKPQPCLFPSINSHSLNKDSLGYQYFLEIIKRSGG